MNTRDRAGSGSPRALPPRPGRAASPPTARGRRGSRELEPDQDEQQRVEQEIRISQSAKPGRRIGRRRSPAPPADTSRWSRRRARPRRRAARRARRPRSPRAARSWSRPGVVDPPPDLGEDHPATSPMRRRRRPDQEVPVASRTRPRRGGERDVVGDQRGAVVDQALAFEHRHRAPRHAQPADDRGRRDRVGRRDDRPERERRRPRQAVDQRVGDHHDRDMVAAPARSPATRSTRRSRRGRAGGEERRRVEQRRRKITRTRSGSS